MRATIDGEEVRRNYSLCTAPDERDWMVTIKRMPDGFFSQWAPQNLKAGDVIEVMSPHGSFTTEFDSANKRHLVGIAGGSGITPVLSLIKSTLRLEPESRFTLLYGNRDSSAIIFLDALADLKDKYLGRFELYHFLDQEEQDIELFNGMLDRTRCEEAIERLVPDAAEVDGWFICGPGPMMDAAEGALLDRGVRQSTHPYRAVHRREAGRRGHARDRAAAEQGRGADRVGHARGRTRRVPFTAGNILDSARSSGLPAPFACKAGVCATCRAKVTRARSKWPRATA